MEDGPRSWSSGLMYNQPCGSYRGQRVSFNDALMELLFGDSGQLTGYKGPKVLVFAVASTFTAFVVVLLDRVIFSVRGRSLFKLSYGKSLSGTARLITLWSVGAGLGGLLGSQASIVQMTRYACITVGVGWPLILPRLIESITKREDEQEPNRH